MTIHGTLSWAGSNKAVGDRASNSAIFRLMITTATQIISCVVNDMPPDIRIVVEAHFFEGESIS